MHEKPLTMRITGYVASLILTISAYLIIMHPEMFHVQIKMAVIVICILATLQAMAQLIFFINIWGEKGPLWNLWVFVSTLGIIFIIIFFSIWIMNHLNYNMMPGM